MRKKPNYLLFLLLFSSVLLGCETAPVVKPAAIIPQPLQLTFIDQYLTIDAEISIAYTDESLASIANYLKDQLQANTGVELSVNNNGDSNSKTIRLSIEDGNNADHSYSLQIDSKGAVMSAKSPAGVFYAVQSLLQTVQSSNAKYFFAGVDIKDEPRFKWRGMHLDVSRHFFGVEKIKRYIDYLAMYKLNTFHWHLTDDQGWRIEIKKYPLLTEQGAWRSSVGFVSNQKKGLNEDNGQAYGGFYTQAEIKEIVAYAAERFVTIVPEIEMPGHTSAVLKAYPDLACEGISKAEIWQEGGVSNNVFCAGREETFEFLQNVLAEVLDLFPSTYIHVGGDEAPKENWKKCNRCQNRISVEKLNDEHELQSYFITRMEKYLNVKGRKLVGWDEILEGGLAPNATVMSWRGVAGGIAAAQSQHEAVMTPGYPLYFNHRPIDLKNTPGHKSSNNTITTVYNYEPIPEALSEEESQYVIGVQANLWTEYIPKWEHVESLMFPRLLSLAEIAWTLPERKDFENFRTRLPYHLQKLDRLGVNYGKDPYQVIISMQMENKKQIVSMSTELPGLEVRYTLDGSEPVASTARYTKPFFCDQTAIIKAAAFLDGVLRSEVSEMEFLKHAAVGKELTYQSPYNPKYGSGGAMGLIDGQFGFEESISFGWQGFNLNDFEATVDLGEPTEIQSISTGFLIDHGQWIFLPNQVSFEISADGEVFETVFQKTFEEARVQQHLQKAVRPEVLDLTNNTRYIRVRASHTTPIPSWHAGAGVRPWIFVDEIVIN